ncbi:unnamed protein product [Lactuca saligna]|uniref:TIR domain-containing protein n=1 Tax=Lactuca saligna TaxID=75948 RepID=A0AA35YDK1_LACSI|nr:unnamed protein product [Lactuca saligna]
MAIITEIQEEEAATTTTTKYDVFLSFRGKDTRLGFVDHLYQALVNENISTFLDEEEFESGEELKPELERAIKSSCASIIVLSKNFASSTWCLDELVMILEQRKVFGHIVLPIFYNVEPTHIRKQESTFGEALFKHKQRIENEKDEEKKIQGARKLEKWTKGLTEIADLIGKNATGRRETVFIEEVVNEISSKLEPHLQMRIPRLIGMDNLITSIGSWLKSGSTKTAEILTIWGMAGIGKTTFAKHMYKLHEHKFERRSFVEDIGRRCAQQTCSKLDLQKQLLGDILKKKKIEPHNVDLSTSKIEKALLRKKTLLVLDDVDNIDQLEALIGTKGFHPGSKIIVTTKDGSITEKCSLFRMPYPPEHEILALWGLSDRESLRLLCWNAFGSIHPMKGFEKEAQRAAKYCVGHPLALEVLGRSLANEDIATWNDVLEMLKAKVDLTGVKKILQIGFDTLPENCKELFKHIACFFVGTDRVVAETILKGCGIQTSYGIRKLIDRCLLTIEKYNVLAMHQLVQDMGRDLVVGESPEKPWKRSRVWNHEESLDLLEKDKASKKIQGLMLDMKLLGKVHTFKDDDHKKNFRVVQSIPMVYIVFLRIWLFFARLVLMFSSSYSKNVELRTDVLQKMDKLKLLQLNHVKISGYYKNFPKDLRWLCMHGFHLKYIPSDLPMDNLVALDMSYSNLRRLWNKPKLLGSLKILNLSYSKLVKAEGFSWLPALERLILRSCERLVYLCESIGSCNSLVILDMSKCTKLEKVPIIISKLKNVRTLSLEGCLGASEFLMQMKDMESYASSSSITKFVPKSPKSFLISFPSSLVTLSLIDNNLSSESFPKDFSSMSMVKKLRLDGNPIVTLPDCVRSLIKLEELYVGRCSMLKSLLCPSPTIKHLLTQHCATLDKITFPQEMATLPVVYFKDSVSLTEIQGIMKFQFIAQVEDQILCSLGWTNVEDVKGLKMQIWDSGRWPIAKKLPIHMFYEFGIFSTCFPGKVVPEWLAQKSNGTGVVSSLRIRIQNETKNRTWIYYGYIFAVQEGDEDIVWLSHWMFRNNEIENGDKVSVTIVEEEEDGGIMVRECAVSPVYNDGDNKEDPLSYYKSWKHIIGGDLSDFQLTSGDYFLIHDRFFHPPYRFKMLFEHKTTSNLVGYTPQYKDEDANRSEHDNQYRPTKCVMFCEVGVEFFQP